MALFRLLILAFAVSLAPATAGAQSETPQFVDSYRDWSLYSYANPQGRVCYIASEPTKEEGDYTRRGPAAVLVAKLPMEGANEQVSVQPGYSYQDGSNVEVTIADSTFVMFTRGEHAWAVTSEDDGKLIGAMKKGAEMSVRGTSTKNTYSIDTYSLLGFTAAYDAMRKACAN
ncbi:MAG: invasion associated locus B family protein [Geminicoccaceae bacterium]